MGHEIKISEKDYEKLAERARQHGRTVGEELSAILSGLGASETDRNVPGYRRQPGGLKGQIWTAPDFDETPDWLIDMFEGKGDEPAA